MNPETPTPPDGGAMAVEPVDARASWWVPPGSPVEVAYVNFHTAARALKQAEDALIAAREVYAEAVKRLSEEAVK